MVLVPSFRIIRGLGQHSDGLVEGLRLVVEICKSRSSLALCLSVGTVLQIAVVSKERSHTCSTVRFDETASTVSLHLIVVAAPPAFFPRHPLSSFEIDQQREGLPHLCKQ